MTAEKRRTIRATSVPELWQGAESNPRALARYLWSQEESFNGPHPEAGFAELSEHDDQLVVLLSALEQSGSDAETAMVCIAVFRYWLYHGHMAVAEHRIAKVLMNIDGSAMRSLSTRTMARLFHTAGTLKYHLGAIAEAGRLFQRGLASIGTDGRRDSAADAIRAELRLGLARTAMAEGDLTGMRNHAQAALELCEGQENPNGRCTAFHLLAESARLGGRLADAVVLSRQALALATELGKVRSQSAELNNLADMERRLGSRGEAARMALRALELLVADGNVGLMPYPIIRLATIALDNEDSRGAGLLLGLADALLKTAGAVIDASEAAAYDELVARLELACGTDLLGKYRALGAEWEERVPDLPMDIRLLTERAGQ